jgi:hypothetical protein
MCSQNAGNAISETQILNISWGGCPQTPPPSQLTSLCTILGGRREWARWQFCPTTEESLKNALENLLSSWLVRALYSNEKDEEIANVLSPTAWLPSKLYEIEEKAKEASNVYNCANSCVQCNGNCTRSFENLSVSKLVKTAINTAITVKLLKSKVTLLNACEMKMTHETQSQWDLVVKHVTIKLKCGTDMGIKCFILIIFFRLIFTFLCFWFIFLWLSVMDATSY